MPDACYRETNGRCEFLLQLPHLAASLGSCLLSPAALYGAPYRHDCYSLSTSGVRTNTLYPTPKMKGDLLGIFLLASASAPCYSAAVCCVPFASEVTAIAGPGHHALGDWLSVLRPSVDFGVRDFGGGLPWSHSSKQQREEKTAQLLPISLSSQGKQQKQVT